jgi:hypothetical protein
MQVADRFHLIKNLREAFARLLQHHAQRSRPGEFGARRPATDYRPAQGWFRPARGLLST